MRSTPHDLAVLGDPQRITAYSRLVAAAYAAGFIALIALSRDMLAPSGKPMGYDFITFWSAGALTLAGDAAAAFDMARIVAVQRSIAPGSDAVFLWHYPPTFQLVAAGLALFPYLVAYFGFIGLSLAIYLAVLRHLVPWREASILLIAFPGTFIAFLHGQNALLSAALMGGALLALDRRPLLAVLCIGLLAYKPQFGVLFPFALMIAGQWRAFGAAAATVAVFVAVSTLVLGADLWRVFFENANVIGRVMSTGELPWSKMPSAFALAAQLGAGPTGAYLSQAIVALVAAGAALLVWWRCGPTPLAGATLVAATLLLPPYLFDYETALLAIPLAILARDLIDRGAGRGEKVLLLVLFVSPVLMTVIAQLIGLQVGVVFLGATLAWSTRRALAQSAGNRGPLDWLPGRMFTALG